MSSKKIVEQWVAKYGNNPEVDKIINERLEYMDKKPHQRLLDGMPPHIAEKVDKMIGNMKEVYELAMESWEGCDGCTEQDKHFFINGFMRGYNMGKPDKIKVTVKNDSPAADIIKAAKAEKQAFKEAVESGNNKPQSAVTWLINELIQNRLMALRYDADNTFDEIYKKAKQMEKEQIIDAYVEGFMNSAEGWNGEYGIIDFKNIKEEISAEKYYNEKYGK